MSLRFWMFDTGFCTANQAQIMRGHSRKIIKTHALAFLLEHPSEGKILFDTGYAPRVPQSFKQFPFQALAMLTPVTTRSDWSLVAQLKKLGVAANDISHVIVSHFHADHIGGLRDFSNSRLIASRKAFEDVHNARGLAALQRAFVPALMPDSCEYFDLIDAFSSEQLEPFGATHDVFGDGLLRLVPMPGHARGQIGLLAQTVIGPVLFAADGAWMSAVIRENCLPSPLALQLISDDARATAQTIQNLHDFAQARPEVWIVPTHCPEIAALVTPTQPRAFVQAGQ
jgi:glyoxylase-like metal-dependent hydrolase (beta-lactamase superfamily II)